jgi:hypothetical protein
MLRKEFSEVLKQSLFFVVLSVTIPFALGFALEDPLISYFEVFFTQYQYGLLIFAVFLGNSLFMWDRKQRATDYLLSLPYSRFRLLGIKVLPRLTAAILFYLVFLLLYRSGGEAFTLFSLFSFSYLYFSLFIIAISLSLSMENYIMMAAVTLLAMAAFLGMIYLVPTLVSELFYRADIDLTLPYLLFLRIDSGKLTLNFLSVVVSLLFPFIASFIYAYIKTGIYPVNRFNKRYFKIFISTLAAGMVSASLVVSSMFITAYKSYYLTEQHRLVEVDSFALRVYDVDRVEEIRCGSFPGYKPILVEEGDYLYSRAYVYAEDMTYFIRFDLKHLMTEKLYQLRGRIYREFVGPWMYKNTIAIINGSPRKPDKELHLIDIATKEVKKVKFHQPFPGNTRLIGTDVIEGKRYWLVDSEWEHRYSVCRVWENGETDNLGASRKPPCYFNGILITYSDDTIVFRKLTPRGIEDTQPVKAISVDERVVFQGNRENNLDIPPLKKIIGAFYDSNNESKKYYWLYLKNLEIEGIHAVSNKIEQSSRRDPELKYNVLRVSPGKYLYIEYKKKNRKMDIRAVYAVGKDELTLLREFPPLREQARVDISKGGIIIQDIGSPGVYAFPDLKELKFKKLN